MHKKCAEMERTMKKLDIHLHLTKKQLPRQKQIFISSAENMLPHLKELGIEFGILQSGGEEEAPFSANTECWAICQDMPEKYAFMCNLDFKNRDTIYERLSRYKSMGAVGIGELTINQRLDDPFLLEIFRVAELLELPVLMHMSPEVGFQYGVVDEPGLPLLEKVLEKYPTLKIIGHSQPFWHEISGDAESDREKRYAWGKGPVEPHGRLLELFDRYPNLYGDLSANSGGCAIMRDETFGLFFLEKYQNQLMFGTDMVNVEMNFSLGVWLDQKYDEGKLSGETYRRICYENAERIFGLSLQNRKFLN